jgi:NADH-quinone oxidoreductase subunit L
MVKTPAEHGEAAFSYVPLITSLVVALGGLYLGWLVYRKFTPGQADPLEKPLGGFYAWMKNKYYFDELYAIILIKPAHWVSETFSYQWIDRKIIDGFLNGAARLVWWLGERLRYWIDLPVINGTGDATAEGTREIGQWMKGMQTGRVQQYMVVAISVVVVLIGFLIYKFSG